MRLEQARDEVRRLDPDLDEDDEAFAVAEAMVYAVANRTHDIRRVAGNTGRPRAQVARWFGRLRANGVFRGKPNAPRFAIADWQDEESGGIAFWVDVLVALGYVARRPAPNPR